ncbi:MAG: SusD/RagB family nutrient-binding outer membrane lipoprotein [Bacteroidales bacterium]|nr:SusD/RagB family nutrient-binding outer membrane lipoprotein [Bacteroidales bacterium]
MKSLYKLLGSALLVVIFAAGCDTDALHEMNINPNAVNEIDVNYFLTAAELSISNNGQRDDRYTDWRTNIGMCAHAIQQLASTSTGTISVGDKYLENDVEPSNAPWDHMFAGDGRITAEIIKQTGPGGWSEGRKINTRHAARILRVLCFHRLTDWYGSIPYFEANKGIEGIFQPVYDKQQAIYTDLLKELDEACAGLSTSNLDEGFAAADYYFKGDIAKWKKFGYSLMLRLAMRVSNVDATMAATYVTKAVAGGVMSSNADNVIATMALGPSEWTNQNGISRGFYPGDGGQWESSFLSKTLVDKLMGPNKLSTADDDPRLMIFTAGIIQWTANEVILIETNPLNQRGLPNGLDGAMLNSLMGGPTVPREHFSAVNPKMMQDDEPYQIMNAAESEFLLAEALVRGIGTGISGTAQQHYNNGVKLAMQMYTIYDPTFVVTDAQVNTYLATYPYGVTKPALEMIGEQMWLCKWMNWWDAWSDYRRTGFPILVPTNYPGNATNGQIPTKLTIPAYEATGNPNYATGATQPDRLIGKVWWDGGPE